MGYDSEGYENLSGAGEISSVTIVAAAQNAIGASAELTYDPNGNAVDGEVITIGALTYQFVDTLVAEGDVKIGVDAGTTVQRLVQAIDHLGSPGVDYISSAAHPTVSASSDGLAHLVTLNANVLGVAGNAIQISTDANALFTSVPAETSNGEDGTPGSIGDIRFTTDAIQICTEDNNTVENQSWRYAPLLEVALARIEESLGSNSARVETDASSIDASIRSTISVDEPDSTSIYSEAVTGSAHTASMELSTASDQAAIAAHVYEDGDASISLTAHDVNDQNAASLSVNQAGGESEVAQAANRSGGSSCATSLTPDGFKLSTLGTEPAAGAAYDGMFRLVAGGAGVADTLKVCVKDAFDAYAWKTVTLS